MKKIKDFLRRDYQKKSLNISEGCPSFEELSSYVNGLSDLKEKEAIELHLAECYHCLDIVTSIYRGRGPKRRKKMKKETLFLIMAVMFFLSSFIFSRYFLQLLAATIVLSIKWIVEGKTNRILVMIYEAWRKGGEREAGRILKDIETKNRIDF